MLLADPWHSEAVRLHELETIVYGILAPYSLDFHFSYLVCYGNLHFSVAAHCCPSVCVAVLHANDGTHQKQGGEYADKHTKDPNCWYI